jgi:hypothetical protein
MSAAAIDTLDTLDTLDTIDDPLCRWAAQDGTRTRIFCNGGGLMTTLVGSGGHKAPAIGLTCPG